jgi:succinate dehydrogenase/fumarate reductase flavoprotein subunit
LKENKKKTTLNDEIINKESMSRRSFLLGAGTVLAGTAIGGGLLAGCKGETTTETVQITTTKTVPTTVQVPTTVVSTVTGQASTITKTETKTVSGTGDTTTVTTTVTSGGYSFEIPPDPIPDSQIKQTYTADIIVIGAGTSGMVCAKSAVENGADVILFSASSQAISRGGSNHGIGTKATIAQGISYDVRKAFKQEMNRSGGRINQQLWYKFYNNSPEAMNWLIDKMEAAGYQTVIEYAPEEPDGLNNAFPGSHCWIGGDSGLARAGVSQPYVMKLLTKELEDAGTTIHWKTIAKQLVRENNNTGRVSAVIAQNEAGEYVKYIAKKAIVMATGDFSLDKEMVAKYCPMVLNLVRDQTDPVNYDTQFPPGMSGGIFKGDGHKMALWVGAAWQRNFPNAPMLEGGVGPAAESYGNFKGLILNEYGQRICSEDMSKTQTCYYI